MGIFFDANDEKNDLILPKKGTKMDTFPVPFFGSKRTRFDGFYRGFGGGEARPQQGRLRHEVASKHRACQTP
jgi:hypothetical protein